MGKLFLRALYFISMFECLKFIAAFSILSYFLLFYANSSLAPSFYDYRASFSAVFFIWWYNLMKAHFIRDLLNGFQGDSVTLTFKTGSLLYDSVASKCQVLHGRYLSTPWLASPHLQTAFVSIFGRQPPHTTYTREIIRTSDGGTVALDWLRSWDVIGNVSSENHMMPKDDNTPIVVVIPGLGSDSCFPYIKHLALKMAEHGWNVCVSNHRGFGGVPLTADRICNAGFTEDTCEVIEHLHRLYPNASIFAVGTSVGANLLVKYLGEEGPKAHLSGAAAISCPWDLLLFDRFLNRSFMNRIYDKAITISLQCHADEHRAVVSRIADWECIDKARSLREFYYSGASLMGNFKSVDTYYRHCSSVNFVGNVSVPLLCINALDDPICPHQAIPWDECRANENIILATTLHGGHIAHFEGAGASSMWWVRAVDEFLCVLHHQIAHESKMEKIAENLSITEAMMMKGTGNKQIEDVTRKHQTGFHITLHIICKFWILASGWLSYPVGFGQTVLATIWKFM